MINVTYEKWRGSDFCLMKRYTLIIHVSDIIIIYTICRVNSLNVLCTTKYTYYMGRVEKHRNNVVWKDLSRLTIVPTALSSKWRTMFA